MQRRGMERYRIFKTFVNMQGAPHCQSDKDILRGAFNLIQTKNEFILEEIYTFHSDRKRMHKDEKYALASIQLVLKYMGELGWA